MEYEKEHKADVNNLKKKAQTEICSVTFFLLSSPSANTVFANLFIVYF